MKKAAYILIACILVCCVLLWVTPKKAEVTDFAMDTVVSISLRAKNAKDTANTAIKEIKRLDALMSVTNPKSDVYKINSAKAEEAVKVDSELFDLLKLCMEISKKTGGAFDITVNPLSKIWDIKAENPKVPDSNAIQKAKQLVGYENIILNEKDNTVTKKKDSISITLGAIAKGYATDKAAKILRDNGVKDAVIDFGGNIYVIGKDKKIGLQTPFKKRGQYFKVCKVSDTSVVTSGAYERYFEHDGKIYHHILNLKTGYPADSGIKSVSIICTSSATADALSTAIFVSGKDNAEKILNKFEDAKAIIYSDDGSITSLGNN